MTKPELLKYAAKLLFQFRVVVNGESSKRRTCEERIVLFYAENAKQALQQAKDFGANEEHNYDNCDGNPVYFEFVGVMELKNLGLECEENEVWYEIKDYLNPMERKEKLLLPESKLHAIRNESGN